MHVNATVSSLDFFWSWQEDYVGAVPLMFAAKGGSIEAAELLVSRLMRRFNRAFPAAGWMIITHHSYDSYEPLQCHRLIVIIVGNVGIRQIPISHYLPNNEPVTLYIRL